MATQMKASKKQGKKYVLIDDDPTYQAIMLRVAREVGLDLEAYESLVDLGSVALLGRYDAAIIDYDLGQLNGVEIGEYLSALFGDIPMILVSDRRREPADKPWPKCIKQFVEKSQGYKYVLDQARTVAQCAIPRSPRSVRNIDTADRKVHVYTAKTAG